MAKAATAKPAKKASAKADTLTAEERAAMKETLQERRRGKLTPEQGEADCLAKIAEMPDEDRRLAEKVHAIVKANASGLTIKTWYGMPAYGKGEKTVCFFQPASKFKARYSTIGFNDSAKLDNGTMWPSAFAVKDLTAADEKQIATLVKKAFG